MLVLRASRVRSLTTAMAVIGSFFLAGCKVADDPPKVASIIGLNATDSVRLGKTINLQVEARDAAGNKLTGRKLDWSSFNPQVATVDANGNVTGVLLGSSLITVRADAAVAQTTVLVQPLVASVVLSPSSQSLPVGSSRALTVAVSDKDGRAIQGRVIIFSSSNPAIATVTSTGTIAGISVGRAVISAFAAQDQVTGTATVDVVQVPVQSIAISPAGAQTVFQGLTLQLAATVKDGNNNILTGRTISWTTSNPAIATVSSTGVVTGAALGNAQITVECEGVTSSVSVTVLPRPVASVGLSPNPGTVKMGSQLQLTLDLKDSDGNQLTTTGRSVVWDSSNKPVATVQDGVVTGITPGNATITVTVDGKPASVVVTVTP